MRIIAGKYRSRPLSSLRGADIRPTSDRLRETLFDVIMAARPVDGTTWLDLFAGTGAVGIEALSRGAKFVCFVESHRKAASLIQKNLTDLKIEDGFRVLAADALASIQKLDSESRSSAGLRFDFCFLDPPYKMEAIYGKVLNALSETRLLAAGAIVIAEHSKHFDPGEKFGTVQRYRKLEQGDAVLSFFRIA